MADMEKVEKGIKACWAEYFYHRCFDCPYKPDRDDNKCVEGLGADALEVLKSQQPKKGEWVIDEYNIHHCPFCHAVNETVYRSFCPNCGADMRGEQE